MNQPPLKPLHTDESLIVGKLEKFRRLQTETIIASLAPKQDGALKARADGTILDGHHRIKILRERGFDVDVLPREIVPLNPL